MAHLTQAHVRTRTMSSSHLSNYVGTGQDLLVSELPTVRDLLRFAIYLRDQSTDNRRNYPVNQLVQQIYSSLINFVSGEKLIPCSNIQLLIKR